MKKSGLLWVLASVFMLCLTYTSCDELDDLFDDKDEKEETLSGDVAFFPKAYADKEVAAWYSYTEKSKEKTKTEAVFLFTDSTFVVTQNKVRSDGSYEREIDAEGTYSMIEGDFTTGKAIAVTAKGERVMVEITDGQLVKGEDVFIKQDNAKLPKATDPAKKEGDNGNNGNNNQGGDSINVEAFFPKAYADKEVAAWYSWTEEDKDKTKIEAVYLFTDSTFVVTKSKVYSKDDGRGPERGIEAMGYYTMIQGDFTTGKAMAVTANGDQIMIEIKDGQLIKGEDVFTKQDNAKCPEASEPTGNNDNHGGFDPQNGDSIGVDAFFPKAYAGKGISAWYSYAGAMTDEGYEMKIVASIYFFDDNTFVGAANMMISSNNEVFPQRVVSKEGQYRIIEGDFTTGKIELTADKTITVEIENGQLKTVDTDNGEVIIYFKQDNNKIPEPSDPTENGNQGGFDPQNGDSISVPAFFPAGYDANNVVAWYSYVESYPGETRIEAIFLFNDNTVIITERKIHPLDSSSEDRNFVDHGSFTFTTDVNYDNGAADVRLDMLGKINITITDGNLVVTSNPNKIYKKRDPKDIPEPLYPTSGGGNNGGIDPQNGDSVSLEAFFPIGYEDQTVLAWYKMPYKDINVEGEEVDEVYAIYFLSDGTMLFTYCELSSGAGGDKFLSEYVAYTYSIKDGDLNNGTLIIHLDTSEDETLEVVNGKINGWTRQNPSNLPAASEPTENSNQGGGDNDDDDDDDDEVITDTSICGTWVDDLVNPYGTLTLNSNGTGMLWGQDFNFTYEDGILVYDKQSKYKVTIDGDVMTWAYIDEEYGTMDPEVWLRSNGTFDKKVSDGRWNGYVDENDSVCGIVYIFNGSELDIYIIAWGEHLKGSFTHDGGVISFRLSEGYNARKGDKESSEWWAGNLDPETLRLTEGYEWWQMDQETLSERKEEVARFTFALVSDVKAYGRLYRSNVIKKAK